MKKIFSVFSITLFLFACNSKKNAPDVSGITVNVKVERFDQDFFSMDTLQLENNLNKLAQKYPAFLPVYLQNIAGVSEPAEIRNLFRFYKPVYDSAQLVYKDFTPVKKELEQAFRYVKYYYPNYKTPSTIIPVIGRMDSRQDLARMPNGEYTPNFIGPDLVGISLQFYIGKNYSLYADEYFINNVVPRYRSRRFSKEYIVADVMKLITDDISPDKSGGKPLVEQMIEKGKQWWLLDKFLPHMADSVKTGYTQQQLDWCIENEGLIWSYIIKTEGNLYTIEPAVIQNYIGEAPFTQGFSQEASPGNLGPWIGWQIIKKFIEKNPDLKPDQLMQATPKQILEEAKYKPK